MGRNVCITCHHPERATIERMMLDGIKAAAVAEKFGLKDCTTIYRHFKNGHVETGLVRRTRDLEAERREAVATSDDPLAHVKALLYNAHQLRAQAEEQNDPKFALASIKILDDLVHSLLKVQEATAASGPAVPLPQSDDWRATRQAILSALEPYPEAKSAVVVALLHVGMGNDEPQA